MVKEKNNTPLRQRVLSLLREDKSFRDSDYSLIFQIWYDELKQLGHDPSKMSAILLMHYMSTGQISKIPSIKRHRRRLNLKYEDTRGKSYIKQ